VSEPNEALDEFAITRLQARYGDVVTRQAWHELVPLFVPDCPIHLDLGSGSVLDKVGAEAIGAFIAEAIARFEFFEFTIVNSVVDVAPGGASATGRLYICELRQEREGHRWTNAYGLYRDEYAKADGRWRFARRDYTSTARTSDTPGSMQVFPIPGLEG
jgi:hypothetical protein